MASSPSIPTSFVPKQPVRSVQRLQKSGNNIFLFFGLILLGAALLGSVGVFAYERYLMSIRDAKKDEVSAVQEEIDSTAVEDFIRTRERFKASMTLLNAHVVSSRFFDLLENMTLQNVRFDSLSFKLAEDRTAEIRMEGVARTFNALAAQSSEFAKENRIKRAIFSDITVDEDERVAFLLTADLAEGLVSITKEEAQAQPEPVTVSEEVPYVTEEVVPAEDSDESSVSEPGTP